MHNAVRSSARRVGSAAGRSKAAGAVTKLEGRGLAARCGGASADGDEGGGGGGGVGGGVSSASRANAGRKACASELPTSPARVSK
jgi:hypothetical protein